MENNRIDSIARNFAQGRSRRSLVLGLVGIGGAFVTARSGSAKPPAKVTLCHKPGTPAEKTLSLPAAAVNAHLGHGDHLGPCGSACAEGEMRCSGTGFETCAEGSWIYRACATNTVCKPVDDSITCDFQE